MTPRMRYVLVVVIISVMATVGLNVLITVTLSERAAEGQRLSSCEIVSTQLAIYAAAPPATATGREAQAAWSRAYSRWNCDQLEPK